jgi:hypothetical protein
MRKAKMEKVIDILLKQLRETFHGDDYNNFIIKYIKPSLSVQELVLIKNSMDIDDEVGMIEDILSNRTKRSL